MLFLPIHVFNTAMQIFIKVRLLICFLEFHQGLTFDLLPETPIQFLLQVLIRIIQDVFKPYICNILYKINKLYKIAILITVKSVKFKHKFLYPYYSTC